MAASNLLLRHGLGARCVHGANALAVIVLLITGYALADALPARVVALLGGHGVVDALHQNLGLSFVIVWLLLLALRPARFGRLLRDMAHFRVRDAGWMFAFLRYLVAPAHREPPAHDGFFDPAQRVVFLLLAVALLVAAATGVFLFLAPPGGSRALGYAIRLHIASCTALLICLVVHIVAGSGLLRTHRGLVRTMFGDGRVAAERARVLWPAWGRAVRDPDAEHDGNVSASDGTHG